ncbi:phosphate butyryltransferase [bacterium]|nr:phosphate butyryltransferase [bacterium]
MKNFAELENFLVKEQSNKLVIVGANEDDILTAAKKAFKKSLVELILIGKREIILKYFNGSEVEIVDEEDMQIAAKLGFKFLINGKANAIMKGLIYSDIYLKELLKNRDRLMAGKLLSHTAVTEFKGRFLILTDAGMNISPSLEDKIEILKNAVKIANNIGLKKPRVALICPVEKVNTKMQCTMDAAIISKMAERGQLHIDALVDGPLAYDVALSKKAAKVKGVKSFTDVPGKADIVVLNGLTDGNVAYKSLEVFYDLPRAAILAGTTAPVILTSRGDGMDTKYNSILFALAISKGNEK